MWRCFFFDIWVAFNPNGLNYEGSLEDSADPMLQNMPDIIPIEQVESIRPSVRVDVSQDNAWSKLAEQQWLDNVFERQQITFEEYVELCNSNAVPKAKLQAVLKKRQAMQQEQQMMQQMQEQTPQEEVPQGEMLIG